MASHTSDIHCLHSCFNAFRTVLMQRSKRRGASLKGCLMRCTNSLNLNRSTIQRTISYLLIPKFYYCTKKRDIKQNVRVSIFHSTKLDGKLYVQDSKRVKSTYLFYTIFFFLIKKNKNKKLAVYCARLTDTCYSTCILLLSC